MISDFLELLLLAIVVGGIYALFAVGISLIFGVLNIINVAHGEFFALGGYAAFLTVALLGLPPWAGIFAGALLGALLGATLYPLLLAPLQRRLARRNPGPMFLVLTLGLSILMQNLFLAAAGGDYLRVPPQVRGAVDFGPVFVTNQRLLILAGATLSLLLLFLFLRYHRQGMAIRAVAENPVTAQAVGVPLARVFTLTVALGCGLAGVGGALIAPVINVYPTMGFILTIKAFAITILAGLGNIYGALAASFVVSIIESLSVLVLPSEWKDAITFGAMIVVLLIRPQGLFSRARP
jgi:branched-chain amino acid transport system permease protein